MTTQAFHSCFIHFRGREESGGSPVPAVPAGAPSPIVSSIPYSFLRSSHWRWRVWESPAAGPRVDSVSFHHFFPSSSICLLSFCWTVSSREVSISWSDNVQYCWPVPQHPSSVHASALNLSNSVSFRLPTKSARYKHWHTSKKLRQISQAQKAKQEIERDVRTRSWRDPGVVWGWSRVGLNKQQEQPQNTVEKRPMESDYSCPGISHAWIFHDLHSSFKKETTLPFLTLYCKLHVGLQLQLCSCRQHRVPRKPGHQLDRGDTMEWALWHLVKNNQQKLCKREKRQIRTATNLDIDCHIVDFQPTLASRHYPCKSANQRKDELETVT